MKFVVLFGYVGYACSVSWKDFHPVTLPFHLTASQELRESCELHEDCRKLTEGNSDLCWGHENSCAKDRSYTSIYKLAKCSKKMDHLLPKFFDQADFGYLKERSRLHTFCSSNNDGDSFVECSPNMRFCRARNIFFDLKSFNVKRSARYRSDIIHEDEVGGRCDKVDNSWISSNLVHKSYLQSWADELQYFKSYPEFEVNRKNCDVIFDRPTWIIKLDAAINMYHHFCDFVNLYASQHINGSFSLDVDILLWDTHADGFDDVFFGVTWKAFTSRKPVQLTALAGKRICFKNAAFSLLARQRYGLFYNMPMVKECSGSGLIHAFSHDVLHRLGISQEGPRLDVVRVTILSRSTKFRRILNIEELATAVRQLDGVDLQIVDYNKDLPFEKQLQLTHNSDVFIGMHGSGLTHLLFLPDWAAVFEIYNCDDAECYLDLARLRGVKYVTWPIDKHHLIEPESDGVSPTDGSPHKKFTNYRFDVDEFKRIVKNLVEFVRRSPRFVDERRRLLRKLKEDL